MGIFFTRLINDLTRGYSIAPARARQTDGDHARVFETTALPHATAHPLPPLPPPPPAPGRGAPPPPPPPPGGAAGGRRGRGAGGGAPRRGGGGGGRGEAREEPR